MNHDDNKLDNFTIENLSRMENDKLPNNLLEYARYENTLKHPQLFDQLKNIFHYTQTFKNSVEGTDLPNYFNKIKSRSTYTGTGGNISRKTKKNKNTKNKSKSRKTKYKKKYLL